MSLDYEKIKHWPIAPTTESYTRQDLIAIARGFGAGLPGALQAGDQVFLRDDEGFLPLPMAVVPLNQGVMWTQDPATGVDWRQTIHAEESITMHKPLASTDTLTARYCVDEIYDKGLGKGALMYESKHLSDAGGAPVATVTVATFLRGNGGFGGGALGEPPKPVAIPADRPADAVVELLTPRDDEHAIFKLAPEIVAAIKMPPAPNGGALLRGVCGFGLAGRALIYLACGNDPRRLKKLGLRYTGPIFTGETLRAELWRQGAGRGVFRIRAVERNIPVLDNGFVEYAE